LQCLEKENVLEKRRLQGFFVGKLGKSKQERAKNDSKNYK
jgi:hypothetical protein